MEPDVSSHRLAQSNTPASPSLSARTLEQIVNGCHPHQTSNRPSQGRIQSDKCIGLKLRNRNIFRHISIVPPKPVGNAPGNALQCAVSKQTYSQRSQIIKAGLGTLAADIAASDRRVKPGKNL